MSNKKQLNVNNEEIVLFSKFLGRGSFNKLNIWFLGNEEQLIKGESPIDKIKNDKLQDYYLKNKKTFFSIPNDIDFDIDNNWTGYKVIDEVTYSNGNNVCVGDFYFLPASSGEKIAEEYDFGISGNRGIIYSDITKLQVLLKNRLDYFFNILKNKKKIVIFHGNEKNKMILLQNQIKIHTGKDIKILSKSENKLNKIQEIYFKESILIITNFFSPTFNQQMELRKIIEFHNSRIFGKYLKTGFFDGLFDTGEKCPECNKRILDYRLAEGVEKCEDSNCGYIIEI